MIHADKDWLVEKYFNEKLSLRKIARLASVTPQAIKYQMDKLGIVLRSVSEANKGNKVDEKTKRKISKSLKKLRNNPEYVESRLYKFPEEPWNKGKPGYKTKPHSEGTKEKMKAKHLGKKMSDSCKEKMSTKAKERFSPGPAAHPLYGKKRPDITGEKHHNWNGGRTKIVKKIRVMTKYKQWRTACFERDNYTCAICHDTKSYMNVDHIIPLAFLVKKFNIKTSYQANHCEELWNVGNGRTLCEKCHRKTDTWGVGTRRLFTGVNKLTMRKD